MDASGKSESGSDIVNYFGTCVDDECDGGCVRTSYGRAGNSLAIGFEICEDEIDTLSYLDTRLLFSSRFREYLL